MRNFLALVLALTIISSPAMASKARLESLGENMNGSMYINDARNVFYNPAFVNDYKKKLFLELGTATDTVDGTSPTTNKAEGGFTNTFGDFTYGVFLGHDSETSMALWNTMNTISGTAFIKPDNAVDFFFGGEAGVKWGVNVMYAGNEANSSNAVTGKTLTSASQVITRFGIATSQMQFFADASVIGKSKGTGTASEDEMKGKIGFKVGGAYTMDNHTFFASVAMDGGEYLAGAAKTKTRELNAMAAEIGMGCKKEMTKSVTAFSRIELGYTTAENKNSVAGTAVTMKQWNVPLVLGAEAQALNWLAIRGSVSHSLLGQTFNAGFTDLTRTNNANSTNVAAGVGMTFGDVVVDGLVSTTGAAGSNTPTVGTSGNQSSTNAGFGFGSGMMTRVGLTYNF